MSPGDCLGGCGGSAAYSFGYNFNGQLGDGATTDRSTPGQVGTDTGWTAGAAGNPHTVAAGNLHTVAVRS